MTGAATISALQAEADMRRWLERAVIGLNLCPFAKAVHVKGQIHYAVYEPADHADHADDSAPADPADPADLMAALLAQAADLAALDAAVRDTTLLIAPNTLADFLDFNDFTARAERQLARAGYDGVFQLASFHPQFQFAGTEPDDLGNATNRAPYPTLHLLREDSVDRAVDAFPEAQAIFERNIDTLQALGAQGWAALDVGPGSAKP